LIQYINIKKKSYTFSILSVSFTLFAKHRSSSSALRPRGPRGRRGRRPSAAGAAHDARGGAGVPGARGPWARPPPEKSPKICGFTAFYHQEWQISYGKSMALLYFPAKICGLPSRMVVLLTKIMDFYHQEWWFHHQNLFLPTKKSRLP